ALARAGEDQRRRTGDDPEHLVRGRVEVVEGVDPVDPGAEPAVAREQLLALRCVTRFVDIVVDEHRQPRVRDAPYVWQVVRLRACHRVAMFRSSYQCSAIAVAPARFGSITWTNQDSSEERPCP